MLYIVNVYLHPYDNKFITNMTFCRYHMCFLKILILTYNIQSRLKTKYNCYEMFIKRIMYHTIIGLKLYSYLRVPYMCRVRLHDIRYMYTVQSC